MTFNLYTLANIHLFVVGAVAITLIASPRTVKWGMVLGLWNQIAWWYVAIHDQAWGVVAVNALYAANYVRGIRNYWRQAG